MGTFARRLVLRAGLLLLPAAFAPLLWSDRDAHDYFAGDRGRQAPLARHVARTVVQGVDGSSFYTGNARFDGEWAVVTNQMAALGLAQVATEHPELREELIPAVDEAVRRLLEPEARAFGTDAWGEDGLRGAGSPRGHAYLGYVNLALGVDRMLRPDSPHAPAHDWLTALLARRLAASPTGMIETYPGETYPPDVCAVAASIGLHDRATGRDDHRALLAWWADQLRGRYLDPDSGLLVQAVRASDGAPLDAPRGSGTAIAAYFLSFSDLALSRQLHAALGRNRARLLGLGGVREYPPRLAGRRLGDIDSGPVLLGVSVSATGFAIASARIHADRRTYRELYRTAHLFGGPVDWRGERRYVTGGALGNAIMLAMLTAGPLAAPA